MYLNIGAELGAVHRGAYYETSWHDEVIIFAWQGEGQIEYD